MEMKKHTSNRARFFVRKKYTNFSPERIVALWSVNKIFPESYKFAAKLFGIIDSNCCFLNKNGKGKYSYLVVNHSSTYFVIHDSDSMLL
jgi:hypothetical protein